MGGDVMLGGARMIYGRVRTSYGRGYVGGRSKDDIWKSEDKLWAGICWWAEQGRYMEE